MSRLARLLEAVKTDLPISVRHERWLASNPNPIYSPKALRFAEQVLNREIGGARKRDGKPRMSSIGSCRRRQYYRMSGMPEASGIDGVLANIFATGNFLHLKWQMAGLTEGWLADAEVARETEILGGTLDGIVHDGSVFEFKTINSRGFDTVNRTGPQSQHVRQVNGYMYLADTDACSIVYENKDSGEWREFRVARDQELIDTIIVEANYVVGAHESGLLPPMHAECVGFDGRKYRDCPFRESCHVDESVRGADQ